MRCRALTASLTSPQPTAATLLGAVSMQSSRGSSPLTKANCDGCAPAPTVPRPRSQHSRPNSDDDEDREQLTSRLLIVGRDMTAFADQLELEHKRGETSVST